MGKTLICLVVLLTFLETAAAECPKCGDKSLEQKYCDAHFVIRVRIRHGLITSKRKDFGYYLIRSTVWKYPTKTFTRLYTMKACGVTGLQPKSRYLVSGTVKKGKLWISSCDSIYHKGRLTKELLRLKRNPPSCTY